MVARFSTFYGKYELVFVLTPENTFSYSFSFKIKRNRIGSSKNLCSQFSCFYLTITGCLNLKDALREIYPNTEFSGSAVFRIWTEYRVIGSISLYSVQMWENTDQKKLRVWTLFRKPISKN